MPTTDPFHVYQLYLATKMHFDIKNPYDFFKYGGKTTVKEASFHKRRDKYFFGRLAKNFTPDQCTRIFANEFYKKSNVWIGKIVGDESLDEIDGRFGRIEYTTREVIDDLFLTSETFHEKVVETPPGICDDIMTGEIPPESAILLLTSLFGWDTIQKRAEAIPSWEDTQYRLQQYAGFVPFDSAMKSRIREYLNTALQDNT